jgi:hypothetical protein
MGQYFFIQDNGCIDMNANKHDNHGRRSGIERREIMYDFHVPERRSGGDRRAGPDRRHKDRKTFFDRIRELFRFSCYEVIKKANNADNIDNPTIPRAANVTGRQLECNRHPHPGQLILFELAM